MNIDPFVRIQRFQQHIFSIDEFCPVRIPKAQFFCQEDGLFRACFFAKSAEDAAQHVDLINRGIFLFPVEIFFSRFPFGRHHGDGFGRTGNRTKSAGRASFTAFIIPLQHMLSAVDLRKFPFHLGIPDRGLLAEKVAERDPHPVQDGRQIDPFQEGHLFVGNYFWALFVNGLHRLLS